MMPSPNVRFERVTKQQFDQIRDWVVEQLDVGKRKVTIDILAAAMLAVVQAHPGELLDAVREQQELRQAKEE